MINKSTKNQIAEQILERPEVQVLLNCARVQADETCRQRISALLRQAIDWHYLMQMAQRNCVQPLLHMHLKAVHSIQPPRAILGEIERAVHKTAIENLFLTQQLIHLVERLAACDVPAIAYKGPVLTLTFYGNLALRQFGDLDFIVREQDIGKAKQLLLAQGFIQKWPQIELSPQAEHRHIQQKYNYTFYREQDDLVVELHWAVTPRYIGVPQQPQMLWQRLDEIELGGKSILTFSIEEMLLILCLHGSNHCWNRLSWICDLAELLRSQPALNWDYVLQLAHAWRSERMLFIGLHLAQTLLNATLPEVVKLRVATDKTALKLARQSYKWLFSEEWLYFKPFEEPLYHLQMRERWRDRIRYCRYVLEPGTADDISIPLPPSLSFLYYLLRPVRLVGKHGLTLLTK